VTGIISMVLLVLMTGALLLVPIGLPGVWLMLVFLAVGLVMGTVGWMLWISLALLTGLAELGEFYILKRLGESVGASPLAFWGAVFGGLAGAVIGVPIPVVGSIVAGFIGTFLGAGMVTLIQTRSVGDASRVGQRVVLARTFAVALKVAVGIVILVAGGLGMIFAG
jgi:uncharacterized protein